MSSGTGIIRRAVAARAREGAVASAWPLVAVVASALALALVWLVRVPFFQQPDEAAHADYAFAFYDAGRPFRVRDARPATHVTAQVRYLEIAADYRATRYDPYAAFPRDNGSLAYFRRVDAHAPPRSGRVPQAGARVPYVMVSYPAPYYLLAAAAMRAAGSSLVLGLFAARALGVLFLAGTLSFAYGIFRALRLDRPTSLLGTAAVGWLPLTTWVSAYVQPDTLTTLLFTATILAALRWKAAPFEPRRSALLGTALAALAFVKFHFAAAALVAAGVLVATQLRRSTGRVRASLALALIVALPLVALAVSTQALPAGHVALPGWLHGAPAATGTSAAHEPALARLVRDAGFGAKGFADAYFGGSAFNDYWLAFGFRGASIVPESARESARLALVLVTAAALAAFLVRQRVVFGKLVRVARGRSPSTALRLLGGDVPLNAYVATTAVLLLANAISQGTLWLEGRYWLPVIVPTVGLAVVTFPRVLRAGVRARAARVAAVAWAVYACVAAPVAIVAMERTFHGPARTAAVEHYATIRRVVANGRVFDDGPIAVRRGAALVVEGAALDGSVGGPAHDVWVAVDGRRAARATTGLPSVELSHELNDDAVLAAGYAGRIDTSVLAPGPHWLRALVVERRAPQGLPGQNSVRVDVVP